MTQNNNSDEINIKKQKKNSDKQRYVNFLKWKTNIERKYLHFDFQKKNYSKHKRENHP